jgi:hypothetical protein
MSQIVSQFDPSTLTEDTFMAPQSAGSGALVFWNESNHRLQISFQDGTNLYVPAWFHRSKCGEIGQVNIKWDILSTLAANFPPISEVVVEAYNHGESFPADGPISERSTNIGNAVGLATSSTSIANDGNVAGTSIVEATVAGDVPSTIMWTNDGKLTNGDAAHPGFVKFDNSQIVSDGSGNLTAHGLTAVNFLVAQNTATVNNGLIFPVGSLSRVAAHKNIATVNGKVTVTHGLGVVPDFVFLTSRNNNTTLFLFGYDPATLSATTIDIWSNGLGGCDLFVLKF